MFDEQSQNLESSANNFIDPAGNNQQDDEANSKKKKIIIFIIVAFLLFVLIFLIWYFLPAFSFKKNNQNNPEDLELATSSDQIGLGAYLNPTDNVNESDNGLFDDLEGVEYVAFSDFYNLEAVSQEINFNNYNLPINIKLDVANYYDISRKLDLESSLNSLNQSGFAVIDNPWIEEADNLYALANLLDERQIPLYISADFISYYYQSILKLAFKEIEENVFYESLWNINKALYEIARVRYESHLSEAGPVNDRVLEGERLATAFFAVSLELLKPDDNQIEANNRFSSGLFNEQERKKYEFVVPSYLNDDVLRELDLIDQAKLTQKSPVLLYDRDYKNFVVPTEYSDNARLNNFYLAATWLNSTFPLNYRDSNCPDCLLDKDDWRINFIAANFIAQDFSISQDLKNEWARVYKSLAFFKGLRDAWNYIDYQDSFITLFPEGAKVNEIFAENNEKAEDNFESLRQKLLERQSLPVQGAYNINAWDGRRYAGLQFLADFYWPNNFILSNLRYPYVGYYQGDDREIPANNVTACKLQGVYQRCQGSAQDILFLIDDTWRGQSFIENSNYSAYHEAISGLRPLVQEVMNNNINNYWSSLLLWQSYLKSFDEYLPSYLQTESWKTQMAASVVASWIDMQLPLDKIVLRTQINTSGTLSTGSTLLNYAWLEPNLEFYQRLLAHNEMIITMFQSLSIHERSSSAINYLKDAKIVLSNLQTIAAKQAQGESLNEADNQVIRDFAKMYSVEKSSDKNLIWTNEALKAKVRQKILAPKLLIMIHPINDQLVLSVGPVFNYQETK